MDLIKFDKNLNSVNDTRGHLNWKEQYFEAKFNKIKIM